MSHNATLDRLFDALPRARIRVGAERSLPSYLLLGSVGALTGFLWMLTLAVWSGSSLLVAFGLGPLSVALFVLSTLGRRRWRGTEQIVLQEQLAVVLGGSAATLHFAGLELLTSLDALTAGLALFLVFGRLGCLLSGCCFGLPSSWGIRYPIECHGAGPHPRRLPVQLLASLVWLGLCALTSSTLLCYPPGFATALALVLYGPLRFGLELLRDDPRPRWRHITQGQAWAVLGTLAGLALWAHLRGASRAELLLLSASLLLALLLWATSRRWLDAADPLPSSEALGRAWADLCARTSTPAADPTTSAPHSETCIASLQGLSLGMRRPPGRPLELSAHRPVEPLSRAEAIHCFEGLLSMHLDPSMVRALRQTERGIWVLGLHFDPQPPPSPTPDQGPAGPPPKPALPCTGGIAS